MRRPLLPYLLVLPILLYEGILLVYPIARGVIGSFQSIELATNVAPEWVGLKNYQRMLGDPEFWKVMQTTLLFTGLVILAAI
ncbi:MAG: sugar ABC transporter permease, partial [Caldilinea sp.]